MHTMPTLPTSKVIAVHKTANPEIACSCGEMLIYYLYDERGYSIKVAVYSSIAGKNVLVTPGNFVVHESLDLNLKLKAIVKLSKTPVPVCRVCDSV